MFKALDTWASNSSWTLPLGSREEVVGVPLNTCVSVALTLHAPCDYAIFLIIVRAHVIEKRFSRQS